MSSRSFFLLWTALLSLAFATNALQSGSEQYRYEGFQADSEWLIRAKLGYEHEHGFGSSGGFLRMPQPNDAPYLSQYGLQGHVLSWMQRLTGGDELAILRRGRRLFALTAAMVLALFLLALRRELGSAVAHGVGLGLLASDWMVFFGPNAYWATALLFAPMAFSFWAYADWPRGRFLAAIAFLVAMKSLCGYEYVSSVILAAAPAVLWHELRRPAGAWLRSVKAIFGLGLAGSAGFALALVLHLAQAGAYFGSPMKGFEAIQKRAVSRVVGTQMDGQGYTASPADLELLPRLGHFLGVHGWSVAGHGPSTGAILLAGLMALAVVWRRNASVGLRLGAALGAGAVASLSWWLLARPHMYEHPHINAIVLYMAAIPMAYVCLAVALCGVKPSLQEGRDPSTMTLP